MINDKSKMELNNIDNDEISIYLTKLSKAISVIFFAFYLFLTVLLFTNQDITDESNASVYVCYLIFFVVLYLYLKPFVPFSSQPQIILSKEIFWTKKTDWIYFTNLMFITNYITTGEGGRIHCYIYLKDFSKIEIDIDNPKCLADYVLENHSEKYILESKKSILSDLETFRERYSVTDEEFAEIARRKVNIDVKSNLSGNIKFQPTKLNKPLTLYNN